MGKKIAAFLLTAAMVLALLPMALAASNAADTAEFQFLLSPHAPDGKVVAADLLLRATAVETVNGFQMSFNGSAKLTGAAIEGARTTAASIGGDTIYWFTTAESDYFTVGTEYVKLATLEFSSDTQISDAWKEISVEDGSSTLTRDLFPAVAVAGKVNNQHVPAQIGSNHIHAADGGAGELVYRPLKSGTYAALPTSGNFYLEGDITVTGNTAVPGRKTLNLCLNGHTIQYAQPEDTDAVRLFSVYGRLNVCSCCEQGQAIAEYRTETGCSAGGSFASVNATGSAVAGISVTNISFEDFRTADGGGVLRAFTGASEQTYAELNVSNCEFVNNYARFGGAAIYVQKYDKLFIQNSTFTQNESGNASGGGGAVCLTGGALLQMSDSDFINNHSTGHGGAVYAKNWVDGCFIQGGTFTQNAVSSTAAAKNRAGGAVCLFAADSVDAGFRIENAAFIGNEATCGGAVSNGTSSADSQGSLVLKDCTFRDNLAETAANAVSAFSKQSTTLDHCTVSRQTDNSLADVQARSGTLYIRNENDIGDLLVTKGDRPTVDITLAAAEFKGDLTIGAWLTVTIHQNGFQGKLTGTVKNEGSIVWDPAQAE